MNKKMRFWVVAVAAVAVFVTGAAIAATQNFSASILFQGPLTLTKIRDLDFGVAKALQSGVYVLSTNGTVTASGGGVALGGGPHAGELFITGSISRSINISTSTFVSNNGVTPSNATCSYNGGAEVACNTLLNQSPPGAGKTLLLGLRLSVNGTQLPGTSATPRFNVTVVYN